MSDYLSRTPVNKKIKGRLLEWMGICHERALQKALSDLDKHFETWRAGDLSPFALNEKVHEFHHGPSRSLYNYYTSVSSANRATYLAYAVRDGLVDLSEMREDVQELVSEIVERLARLD